MAEWEFYAQQAEWPGCISSRQPFASFLLTLPSPFAGLSNNEKRNKKKWLWNKMISHFKSYEKCNKFFGGYSLAIRGCKNVVTRLAEPKK